jgi:hypothetical protein
MKLSEAMMLGGTVHKLDSGSWECCLLGVSVQALGADNHSNLEAAARWSWIDDDFAAPESLLAFCGNLQGRIIISNLSCRVQDGTITLEQAVDWVRSVEPSEPDQEQAQPSEHSLEKVSA